MLRWLEIGVGLVIVMTWILVESIRGEILVRARLRAARREFAGWPR